MNILCFHTLDTNIDIFEHALITLDIQSVKLTHEVHADLLAEAEHFGSMSETLAQKVYERIEPLASGYDAIVISCSTIGPIIRHFPEVLQRKIFRVDEALAKESLSFGEQVLVLYSNPATESSTRELFDLLSSKNIRINYEIIPGSWDLFRQGNKEEYIRSIANFLNKINPDFYTVVALAQASMSDAVRLTRVKFPILTSPASGLKLAIDSILKNS